MSVIHLCMDMMRWVPTPGERKFLPEDWVTLKNNIQILMDELALREVRTIFCAYDVNSSPFFGTLAKLQERKPCFRASGEMIDFELTDTDLIALKNKTSAVTIPGFTDWLHEQATQTIILSGFSEGHNPRPTAPWARYDGPWDGFCISETAHDLSEAGFKVIIAAEATNAPLPGCYRAWPGAEKLIPPTLDQRRAVFKKIDVRVEPIEDILLELAAADLTALSRAPAGKLGLG